jgi:enamine deaminase RidA (YjgF/YER057c/UK114 family)
MPLARQVIHSDQAPKAIGPYSQAMRVGDLVFMAEPYPPRTTVAVASLPKNARVEVECLLHLG